MKESSRGQRTLLSLSLLMLKVIQIPFLKLEKFRYPKP